MHSVTIVQRVLPHYRIPMFAQLHALLAEQNIALRLVYGQELPGTVPKSVAVNFPWASAIRNRYVTLPGGDFVWQPCLAQLRGTDLIIVEQANALLLNYWLLLQRRAGAAFKLAYWGHGRNFQAAAANGWRERWKQRLTAAVDWWFAYTEASLPWLRAAGVQDERITVLDNSIDTTALRHGLSELTPARLDATRRELGLASERVAIYCGGLYAHKRLDFVLESCHAVRARIPDFEMIFIGDGPMQGIIEEAARQHPWIHYVGPRFGDERLPYFALAQLALMPGLVGLAVIDSFVTGVPLVTTEFPYHSPEIAYLRHGENGLIVDDNVAAYADAVAAHLAEPAARQHLVEGCRQSAARYSMENMVMRYAAGIRGCLRV